MTEVKQAQIGIIGGSGFYSFFEESGADFDEISVDTPYGKPSDNITIGELFGKKVAFIPRHGRDHRFLPHLVNYRANVWALKSLGVTRVISPCAAGSLQKHVKPGDFVICDQFVDWTDGRKNTFFEGPKCVHPSAADPYCPELRNIAITQAKKLGITVHEKGTVVIINGPRFTTKAESEFFTRQGWEVINMSQYPEVHLVRELDMCPVTIVFKTNISKLKTLLVSIIENIPLDRNNCECYKTSHTS